MLKILMFLPGETRGHKINRMHPPLKARKEVLLFLIAI
jgi:hypothetical protein